MRREAFHGTESELLLNRAFRPFSRPLPYTKPIVEPLITAGCVTRDAGRCCRRHDVLAREVITYLKRKDRVFHSACTVFLQSNRKFATRRYNCN